MAVERGLNFSVQQSATNEFNKVKISFLVVYLSKNLIRIVGRQFHIADCHSRSIPFKGVPSQSRTVMSVDPNSSGLPFRHAMILESVASKAENPLTQESASCGNLAFIP